MSSKPEIIELSSDSSEMEFTTDWRTIISQLPSSDSYPSSYSSSSEDDRCSLCKKEAISVNVSKKATSDQAVSSKKATSARPSYRVNNKPVRNKYYDGRVQVLGLPNEHTWEAIQEQKSKKVTNKSSTTSKPTAATKGKGKMYV